MALPVTGQGLVCGTSASSAPSVTTRSTPSSPRNVDDHVGERTPAEVRLHAEEQDDVPVEAPAGGRGRRPSPASRSFASGPPRARRADASPGSRRSSPDRSLRSALPPRASRDTRSRARRPGPRRSSRGTRRSGPVARALGGSRSEARRASTQFRCWPGSSDRGGRKNNAARATVPAQTAAASTTWTRTSPHGSSVRH